MTVTDEERLARVALNALAEPGDPRMAHLVADLGAVRVRQHLTDERDLAGLRTDVALRLADLDPERDLARADALGVRFVVPGDPGWPVGLGGLSTAGAVSERGGVPVGLWVRGNMPLPGSREGAQQTVAVVGSRSATTYGTRTAAEISAWLGGQGICVVSGAAMGIDQAAHRGALVADAPTVAVLACGADRVYPTAHRALIDRIAEVGAVVSETPLGGTPTRIRFLSRNRLIAAMSDVTVVVEAAIRSGALSTASWAERLNRPLLGVPGPVTSAQSQGVHERIRQGRAGLVTCGEDVLEYLGSSGEHLLEDRRDPVHPRDTLPVRQRQVLEALPSAEAAPADEVAREAGIGLREVQGALLRLQRLGWVTCTDVGWELTPAARR